MLDDDTMAPLESTVAINGHSIRLWKKGTGPAIAFLAGFGGLQKWTAFLELLSQRRTVVVPSLPGFPGGSKAHSGLHSHLDWIVAVRTTLLSAGLREMDLVGSSIGGALAAEIAALWPDDIRRLVLIGPMGIYDERLPSRDPWAIRSADLPTAMCAKPDAWLHATWRPDGIDEIEWQLQRTRANEASARLLWPLGDTELRRRIPLIKSPTLLVWGEGDRIVPHAYAGLFSEAITAETESVVVEGAGHLAELDAPEMVAERVLRWVDAPRLSA